MRPLQAEGTIGRQIKIGFRYGGKPSPAALAGASAPHRLLQQCRQLLALRFGEVGRGRSRKLEGLLELAVEVVAARRAHDLPGTPVLRVRLAMEQLAGLEAGDDLRSSHCRRRFGIERVSRGCPLVEAGG
ncbi:hypothetical protein Are01nite_72610 [Actinoplanes regularis]|nr:hypothetical protein Are01nite_72610 [Actinoplanes regularis]